MVVFKKYKERSMYPINPYTKVIQPPDLLFNNTACWFRPTIENLVVKDIDNKISQITDLSGNGRHLLQSIIERRPIWSIDGARFFENTTFMKCINFPLVQPTKVYIVAKIYSIPRTAGIAIYDGGATNSMILIGNSISDWQMVSGAGKKIVNQIPASELCLIENLHNSSNSYFSVNKNKVSGILNSTNANGFTLSSIGAGLTGYTASMMVKEIIIRTIIDNESDNNLIVDYLYKMHGI